MAAQSFERSLAKPRARHVQRIPVLLVIIMVFVLFHKLFGTRSYRPVGGEFPRKIWQTWKTDAAGLDPKDAARVRTWTRKNPMHRYELLTDENSLSYVKHHFGPTGLDRPDIVHVYQTLNAKIIKADLLRYLVMYVEGGLYADIDVECLKPIELFVPNRYNEKELDLVVGVETDMPEFKDHPILGQKAQSLVQWTFMGKPRLSVMMRLIENIIEWLDRVSKQQGKPISDIKLDFDDVLVGTGPSAFTTAILTEMSVQTGREVTWNEFHGILDSKVVAGILVLTAEAFAAGTGHSDSGTHAGKGALVRHHFHASSWPTNHPRFKHPIYDEVERCNWNAECIKLWDSNTAFFDSLPEEDQLKLVAAKKIEDKKRPLRVDDQGLIGVMSPVGAADRAAAVELPPDERRLSGAEQVGGRAPLGARKPTQEEPFLAALDA
ncbi:uncharacterized protein A1O9_05667 [Exophiala aquamarina CBS 119918]|uniref:Glycosyl transferase n=1 Tax=Exophiala aquamarina CBS 119918 TaxID=1182545 RepID=A0A072PDA6_9EURO|nr:uncharacterized protein A1O9_05667 [Exophiala aquamarina CBS 119918]KEF57747.1 hypothetical protein A1O9_05667 [Exophiala aquamarina CBS 119918]